MEDNPLVNPAKERSDAIIQLEVARARLASMGAVDSEYGFINSLREEVESGKKSPREALDRLYEMLGARNDYH